MVTEVFECELTRSFRLYAEMLAAVGMQVDEAAVAGRLADGEEEEEQVRALLATPEEDEPIGDEAPPGATGSMEALQEALSAELRGAAAKRGLDLPAGDEALVESLCGLPDEEKDGLADAILLNGQARFVQQRYMDAAAFQRVLRQRHDPECLALVKLVPYVREQLRMRGIEAQGEEVEAFFEPATRRRVPYCLKGIMAGVNGQFNTGLIPLEDMVGQEDPGEWLERARQKLLFRSHSAMHKAISEATTLKYDCVHKALSGCKKAKRIQAEIKYCLEVWLAEAARGKDPQVDDEYRGVPVEWTCALLPQLEEKFESKEEIYRVISEKTGIKAGSVRRYFQSNGQLKCAPLTVYRLAKRLAANSGGTVRRRPARSSYLADQATRQTAWKLAAKVNAALRRWQEHRVDADLELEYRQLRRSLIVAIKEQHKNEPAVA